MTEKFFPAIYTRRHRTEGRVEVMPLMLMERGMRGSLRNLSAQFAPTRNRDRASGLALLLTVWWAMIWLSPIYVLSHPVLLIKVVSAFIQITLDIISGR